uniref:Uncharacterized protein n=1 Tax=Panagrolaimus sp. PS1159 TaxID=55785 RepID=A0AC35FD30_9BILA
MNGHSAALISLFLAILLSSVHSKPHMNDELFNSLILRGYRPYSGRLLSYLEPRRVTRQGNDFSGALARRSCQFF